MDMEKVDSLQAFRQELSAEESTHSQMLFIKELTLFFTGLGQGPKAAVKNALAVSMSCFDGINLDGIPE